MTKEELKKEADEYANHNDWFEFSANVDKIGNAIKTKMERAYLAGAEPREKQIAELTEQNTSLLTSVENLNKSVQELEAQIEKMKRCEICKYYQWKSCSYHSNWVKNCKENRMKLFELKEIKEND